LLFQTFIKKLNENVKILIVLWIMTRVITLIILIIPLLTNGQIALTEETAAKLNHSNDYVGSGFDEKEIENYLKEQKLKLNLKAGAFFGTGFGSGEYYGTYVSPEINYRVSPRFTVKTGISVIQSFGTQPGLMMYEATPGSPSAPSTRSLIYASGTYKLNERLMISGTVYKSFNTFNGKSSNPASKIYDYQGVIMGIDYKVGRNIFIQGQIEFSDSPYSRYSYPYSGFGHGYGDPVHNPFPSF